MPRDTLSTDTGVAWVSAVQRDQGRDKHPTTLVSAPRKSKAPKRSPIPGIIIPNLSHRPGKSMWHDTIQQWEQGDPENGVLALKDWPEEW